MTTIMTRGGAEKFWGEKLLSEVAYLSHDGGFGVKPKWIATTWKDIFAKRKAIQDLNLWSKRRSSVIVPCFLWVFYNDSFIYGGWWLYIKTLKKDYALNFRNENRELQKRVMQLFPCGMLPFLDNIEKWMIEFAKNYHHVGFKRKIQGLVKCYVKINERGSLIDIIPAVNYPRSKQRGILPLIL